MLRRDICPTGLEKEFSVNLIDIKQQQKEALDKANAIVTVAETGNRGLTATETESYDAAMKAYKELGAAARSREELNTIRASFAGGTPFGNTHASGNVEKMRPRLFSAEYAAGLLALIQSNGKKVSESLLEHVDPFGGYPLVRMGANLYEGSPGAGGYAVPSVVNDQIVPLAPQEMAVRQISTVIPTTNDVKFPVKSGFGTASAKAETSAFGESELTIGQFTLSAFMAGIQENLSWELAQDVPAFQATTVDDMILAQSMYEENLYVNGNGSGEAQGLVNNVGAGVTEEPDTNGNLVSVNGTLDLIAKLNAVYHPNASWLMGRPTSIIIRKAQVESNLFNPVWTRVGTQDFLHGYPVYYSASMPTAARGAAPVLFGDFKRGYLIGDRGGAGINVKLLDQPMATSGIIVLLAYRRTDGRVRRSEAIQQYNIASS